MPERSDAASQLRNRIVSAMQEDTGVSQKMAEPLADSIMRCLAGEQPYFPTIPRSYPVKDIAKSLEGGTPVSRITSQYGISRSKLYELFPGGASGKKISGTSER